MSSVFNSLRRLFSRTGFPDEDFFTEIVAHFLATHPSDTLDWLQSLGVTELEWPCEVSVQTQYQCKYEQEDISLTKYPDILITLRVGTANEIIFVESKTISKESGEDQLSKYSAILSGFAGSRKTLLFVTRDYYPKDQADVHAEIPPGAKPPDFIQTRWFRFAKFLQTLKPNPILDELRKYMNEHALDRPDVFTPFELSAMAAFPRALSVMRAVLDQELRSEFEAICGIKTNPYDDAVQILRHDTFVIQTPVSKSEPVGVGIGFWFGSSTGEFPQVFAQVSHSKAPLNKAKIVKSMQEFADNNSGWSAEGVGELSDWGRIVCGTSLTTLIGGPSHVDTIKQYLRDRMAEIQSFAQSTPELQWPEDGSES